ncbi:hypothetical protein T07_601 [Trichinella nelsoni]|uniref:Secreted protein n=1 Tax=Trichinella nelsoni TaxID=6336 RepID=A0A0V0SKC7_9BILA|nr:hypothetical protein T07_601 [Trichinella nelsoni]
MSCLRQLLFLSLFALDTNLAMALLKVTMNIILKSEELKFKQKNLKQTTTKNLKLTMFARAHVMNVFPCHTAEHNLIKLNF